MILKNEPAIAYIGVTIQLFDPNHLLVAESFSSDQGWFCQHQEM